MKYSDIIHFPNLLELCDHSDKDFEYTERVHNLRARSLYPWLTDGCKILDLGCGSSIFFIKLLEICPTIVPWGIDKVPKAIETSKELFPTFKNNFICENILDVPNHFERCNFDIVLCSIQLLTNLSSEVLDWIAAGESFLYLHSLPSLFKSTKDLVLNLGYSSQILNDPLTVRTLTKINRIDLLPLKYTNMPLDNFSFDFGYMQDIYEKFHTDGSEYFLIDEKKITAIVKKNNKEIEDLFILRTC